MKKIILVPLLLLVISSCTLPFGNKNDGSFVSLYNANIHSNMVSYEEMGTLLGINRHESFEGLITSSLNVPGILSGSLESKYAGLIDGRNSESFFRNIRVLFTSLVSSGSLTADEIGLVSQGTDSFMSYKNVLDIGLIPEEMKPILRKYENTWLNIAEKSTSDMSADELIAYNIAKNLLTKSLVDIEKYATDYPIWKETADLGMSGALHMWMVDFDRANILALTKKLSQDLTGTGMTEEYAKNIETNLASVSFSGTIGFDPANPKVSSMNGTISASGVLIVQIAVVKNENNGSITIGNPREKVNVVINYGKTENKYTFDAVVQKSDIEMGKASGYIEKNDKKFKELSLEASAQGMTVSLKHTMDDNKFAGKLSAVVATLEWSGTVGSDRLMGLKINGTTPAGSLSVDLTNNGSDTMIRGPVLVKSGEETLASATVALEVAREKFGFIVDVLSEQFPVHFDLMIAGKTTPSNKKVIAPVNTKSLQDLIKDIDAMYPSEIPSELSETDMDTTLDSLNEESFPSIQ